MDEYKRRRRRSRAVMSMFLDSLGGSIDNVDVATFDSDGTDLKALVVGIEPIQSGMGDPSPDNVRPIYGHTGVNVYGTGKNFVNPSKYEFSTKVLNGLNLAVQPDGTITATGTASGTGSQTLIASGNIVLPNGTCTYINEAAQGVNVAWRKENKSTHLTSALSTCFTVDEAFREQYDIYANVFVSAAGNYDVVVHPQIELGSTATAYSPYIGTTYPIPLGQTVYGGTLDVLTGVLTVTHANIPSYNGEAINEPWISSMDAYSPGATPTTGAQVVYPLATPTTVQLTGQQIATFLGTNNVWCDSGKIIHLEY